MNVRAPLQAFVAAACIAPLLGHATGLSLTDACGRTVSGSQTGILVNSGGDVAASGFAAPYAAGVGKCETAAGDNLPRCTLSASQIKVAPPATVTLFANCTSSPTNFTWARSAAGPALPTGSDTSRSIDLTFTAPGSYTYAVAGRNTTGLGPVSGQVTILVGDTTQKPTCLLTASPVSIGQSEKSALQVSCNPEPASYTWTAAESGAPAPPSGSGSELTFQNAGVFTYKVQGVNSVGSGPVAAATVTVAAPPGPPPSTNLIPNGSFESPVVQAGTYVSPLNSSSWSASPGYTGVITSGYMVANGYPAATDGSQVAFYDQSTYLRQVVNLAPGAYSLTFKAMLHTCCAYVIPRVNINGAWAGNAEGMGAAVWRPVEIVFGVAGGPVIIDFTVWNSATGYVYIDDVKLVRR